MVYFQPQTDLKDFVTVSDCAARDVTFVPSNPSAPLTANKLKLFKTELFGSRQLALTTATSVATTQTSNITSSTTDVYEFPELLPDLDSATYDTKRLIPLSIPSLSNCWG